MDKKRENKRIIEYNNSDKLEGVHMGFLWKVTGNTESRQWDRTWSGAAVLIFLKEEGTQTPGTYIDRWQTKMTEWVTLILIYEVCDMETGRKRGERRSFPRWWQTASWKRLRDT